MNFLVWVFIAFCSSLILTLGTKSGAVFATTLPETPNADHFAADDVDKLEYEEQDPTAANLHFSGETALGFDFHQKPSSLKNHNQFNIPYFSLRLDTEPWESGSAHIAFGLEPQAVGKKSLTANELYAELEGFLPSILGSASFLQFGLVPNPHSDFTTEIWPRIGEKADFGFQERFGYEKKSDYGLQFGGMIGKQQGSWVFRSVNGGGYDQNENGPYKDVSFHFDFLPFAKQSDWGENLFIYATATRGYYENIDQTRHLKNRDSLAIGWQEPGVVALFAEGFLGGDAVDGVQVAPAVNSSVADGADFTERAGEIAESQGAWMVLKWHLESDFKMNRDFELILRKDFLDPDKNISNNSINNQVIGFRQSLSDPVDLFYGYESTSYGEKHSVNSSNQELYWMSLHMVF